MTQERIRAFIDLMDGVNASIQQLGSTLEVLAIAYDMNLVADGHQTADVLAHTCSSLTGLRAQLDEACHCVACGTN